MPTYDRSLANNVQNAKSVADVCRPGRYTAFAGSNSEENPLSLFTTIRQKPAPWTRRVFGLLVVVWLNIALQPCVMAFSDLSDHGCPGCPPSATEDISSYSARDAGNSSLQASMCASGTADCTSVDDINFGGRATSVGAKDAPGDLPIGIAPAIDVILLADSSLARRGIGATSFPPGASPPLNILYCTFLI